MKRSWKKNRTPNKRNKTRSFRQELIERRTQRATILSCTRRSQEVIRRPKSTILTKSKILKRSQLPRA